MPKETRFAACAEIPGVQLQRLARALEEPVEAFFGDKPFKSDAAKAAELLRLWHTIRDPQNRETLLLAARGFVEREADVHLAAE